MLASGFAGLGYQIVWTQQFGLWLGHEAPAVLAVITAIFGGLAAGALLLGRRIERSARAAWWYAGCEALIGLWSLLLALLPQAFGNAMLQLIGVAPSAAWQWTVAFAGCFVLLLPATAAMGVTLPAIERVLAQQREGCDSFAALYAGNTLGAVLGVLASAFWLVPQWGLARSAVACAALNGLCALAVLVWAGGRGQTMHAEPAAASTEAATTAKRGLLLLLAATGLLGIGYEVLVVRVLSQVAENTVYTYALLLAVYLVGTALGAAAYQRWGRGLYSSGLKPFTLNSSHRMCDRLLVLQAAACLLGAASLWGADRIKALLLQAGGPGMGSALAAEALLALAAFGPATLVMGALFSHLSLQARAAGHGFGHALGSNTLGAAAAPLLCGVLLPALGAKAALLGVAGAYLLLALLLPREPQRRRWTPTRLALTGALLLAAAALPPLMFVDLPEGGRIVSYQEGAMAAVSVVEDADGVAVLRINNRQQEGSSATLPADARQAWLPLLLRPAPRQVLFLGLGTGTTASTAAEDPGLQVDAVELLPEVIAASAYFASQREQIAAASRPHLMAADARRYVKSTDERYDLIISDNFHPARSGSAALYTVEHFAAVRDRLSDDGLFCQWLPLHQLDLATLRSILRSYLQVYPGASAMLATNSLETPVLGLVARRDGRRFPLAALRQRLTDSALAQRLRGFGLHDEFSLLGSFIAGPAALTRFAGDAALNTDDRPVVAYLAPRITYAHDSLPRDRLLALLAELRADAPTAPADIIDTGSDNASLKRLAAYWLARDRFIEAGRDVQLSTNPQQMLNQVREPLLAVLRTSPDFRPAYDPLLRLALALARSDPTAARALLQALAETQPARPEARQALDRIAIN